MTLSQIDGSDKAATYIGSMLFSRLCSGVRCDLIFFSCPVIIVTVVDLNVKWLYPLYQHGVTLDQAKYCWTCVHWIWRPPL
jgi:hypothetical protein